MRRSVSSGHRDCLRVCGAQALERIRNGLRPENRSRLDGDNGNKGHPCSPAMTTGSLRRALSKCGALLTQHRVAGDFNNHVYWRRPGWRMHRAMSSRAGGLLKNYGQGRSIEQLHPTGVMVHVRTRP